MTEDSEETGKISVFPPLLKTQLPSDESASAYFTRSEISTLRNAWRQLRPKLSLVSRQIYMDLFLNHEHLIDCFRVNGIVNVNKIGRHPRSLVIYYGYLIESLDNPHQLKNNMKQLSLYHKNRDIKKSDWLLLVQYANKHFLNALLNSKCPKLVSCFDKLKEYISVAFDAEYYIPYQH